MGVQSGESEEEEVMGEGIDEPWRRNGGTDTKMTLTKR